MVSGFERGVRAFDAATSAVKGAASMAKGLLALGVLSVAGFAGYQWLSHSSGTEANAPVPPQADCEAIYSMLTGADWGSVPEEATPLVPSLKDMEKLWNSFNPGMLGSMGMDRLRSASIDFAQSMKGKQAVDAESSMGLLPGLVSGADACEADEPMAQLCGPMPALEPVSRTWPGVDCGYFNTLDGGDFK